MIWVTMSLSCSLITATIITPIIVIIVLVPQPFLLYMICSCPQRLRGKQTPQLKFKAKKAQKTYGH